MITAAALWVLVFYSSDTRDYLGTSQNRHHTYQQCHAERQQRVTPGENYAVCIPTRSG